MTMFIVGLVGPDVPVESLPASASKITVVPTVTRQLSAISLNVSW